MWTRLRKDEKLELGPLRNLPVIRDLVTDMREFFDKWARAKGEFRGSQTRQDDFARVPPQSEPRNSPMRESNASAAGCATPPATW